MVQDLAPDMAALIGCWCTTMLYGVNIVLFLGCMYVLIYKHAGSRYNWMLITASLVQFFISTAHAATVLRALIEGFVWSGRIGPSAIMDYWLDMGLGVHVTQEILYITNSVLGDAVLVWRLYVVYPSHPWICIGPAIMVLATAACGYRAEFELSTLSATDPLFLERITEWLLATWCLSIAVQVIVTSLIAFKIWYTSFKIWSMGGSRRHLAIIWTIVESGAIYSAATVTLLVLFVLKMQAGAVVGDSLGQISAIVPSLIIVRVGLNLTHGSETGKGPTFSFHRNRHDVKNNHIPVEVGVMQEIDVERSNHSYSLSELTSSTKIGFGSPSWDESQQLKTQNSDI